jgi:hypothetical protein
MRVLPDGRVEEDLTSQIDGQVADFTITYPSLIYTVDIFINGLPQGLPGASFSMINDTTVRILPFILRSPDKLWIRYTPR